MWNYDDIPFEQLSLSELLSDFLEIEDNIGKRYSMDEIAEAIKTLQNAQHLAENREKKAREEQRRKEQEERERQEAHVQAVTSMDLPLDWDNVFDSDPRSQGIHTDSIGTKRTSYRSQYLKVLNDTCPLYHDFVSGTSPKFREALGLASNLTKIESGTKTFKDILQKQMKVKQRTVDVWSFYLDYLKDRDPQLCAAFCPHKDTCKHGMTMLSTLKPALHQMERIFNDEHSLVSLDEAVEDFSTKFNEALNSPKNGWHIIKCQTALGKTRSILQVLEDVEMSVILALPTNALKREVYDRADDSFNSIGVSPSLHEIEDELSENLWDKIESLYNRGKSPWSMVSKILLEAERAEKAGQNARGKAPKKQNNDIEVLRKYQGELLSFKKSKSVITTHKRLTTMDHSKFDVVIVDEDIIFSTIIPSRETVPVSMLKRLKKKLPPPDPLAIKIKDLLDKRKEKDYFYLDTVKFDDDYDEIKLEVNIRALCEAEYFYYQRADDIDSSVSEDSIIFVKPVTFGRSKNDGKEATGNAKDTKFIMLSATANRTICEHVFGEDNVTFYECVEAEITGRLNLYPERPMSRSYIKDHIEVMDQIKKFTGVEHTITFKKFDEYCTTEMHFGNCSGSDILKGKDIDVIGTPHQPEWIYKLFAYSLNHDIDSELKPHTLVTHNGFRFRFTTYDDEFLRTIQFYLIESDLEQAVGRARLLRCDCTVNLFSNFPLRQAMLMEADF